MERSWRKYAARADALAPYLAARGLATLATASSPWGLGLVEDPEPGHEHVRGRLSLPYLTRAGCVDIKFACIRNHEHKTDGCAKYLYGSGGTEHRLFNVNALFEPSDVLVMTEGEFDAIACHELAGVPAVSYPGTSGFKDYMARCFAGYGRVLVVADGDEPGREAARDVAKKVGRFADSALVIRMPDGHDSNSFIAEFGAQAYRETLGV